MSAALALCKCAQSVRGCRHAQRHQHQIEMCDQPAFGIIKHYRKRAALGQTQGQLLSAGVLQKTAVPHPISVATRKPTTIEKRMTLAVVE